MRAESRAAAGTDSAWGELLLVDDDAVFARVLGRALNARGFTVHSAASSGEAIAQLNSDRGLRLDGGGHLL
jgi:ActR/RegA family two-component response regulator